MFIRILTLCIGIGAALPCGVQPSDGSEGKRGLMVHSYHETQKGHVVEMDQALELAHNDYALKKRFDFKKIKILRLYHDLTRDNDFFGGKANRFCVGVGLWEITRN